MYRFRRTSLLVLMLLVGAIISVGCGGAQETPSPAVTATSTIPAPTQTATPTAVPRPTAAPIQLPTVSDGALRVLSSRAALVPPQFDPVRVGSVLPSPAFQTRIGGEGGITVSVSGSVTLDWSHWSGPVAQEKLVWPLKLASRHSTDSRMGFGLPSWRLYPTPGVCNIRSSRLSG